MKTEHRYFTERSRIQGIPSPFFFFVKESLCDSFSKNAKMISPPVRGRFREGKKCTIVEEHKGRAIARERGGEIDK